MQERDFQWFLSNYSALYSKYGDTYIVIQNQKVVSTHCSFADGVRFAQKKLQPGTYIVQHCNGDESGYTESIASTYFMDD